MRRNTQKTLKRNVISGTVLVWGFVCLIGSSADASTTEFSAPHLIGTDLVVGTRATAFDDRVFNAEHDITPGWESKFSIAHSRSWVSLAVEPYGGIRTPPLRLAYRANVQLAMTACSVTSGEGCRDSSVTLQVDYDPEAGTRYRTQDLHQAENTEYLSVVVESFRVTEAYHEGEEEPVEDPDILQHFVLDVRVQEEQFYKMPESPTVPVVSAPEIDTHHGEIRLSWEPVSWAEQYEVEWTHVNDYGYVTNDETIPAIRRNPEALTFDFRFESTRIPVEDSRYALPLIFDRGYVVWRVRAVTRKGPDFHQPIQGPWGPIAQESGVIAEVLGNGTIAVPVHSIDFESGGTARNWQHVATFAEGGRRKDLVQYLDGSLRARQTVTKLNTDNILMVSENMYDHSGRPALEMLPSPIPREAGRSTAIAYQANFNLNQAGQPYSFRDFERRDDGEPTCERPLAEALQTTVNGAGRYFSRDNPYLHQHQAYVPDAHGFPFAQRTYTPDNTGRIHLQGGVGPHHQIGCGHEHRHFYGKPDQAELDRLFGNDAGLAQHYKKRLSIDPDGQASIEYLDPAGRVVATALSGDAPSTLLPLANQTSFRMEYNLLEQGNQLVPNEYALRSNKTLLVTKAGQYDFLYQFTPPDMEDETCERTSICLDCIYDLEIQITNHHGHAVRVTTQDDHIVERIVQTIGNQSDLLQCDEPRDSERVTVAFSANLSPGSYRVMKRLTVNTEAADRYVDEYMKANRCLPEIRTRLQGRLAEDFDPAQCESECVQCERVQVEDLPEISPDIDPPLEDVDLNVLIEQRRDTGVACTNTCNVDHTTSPCEAAYQTMLADVSPGGQYAQYLITRSTAEGEEEQVFAPDAIPLSVLNATSYGNPNWNRLTLRNANWRNPTGNYRNADGSLSRIPISDDDDDFCVADSEGTESGYCLPEHLNRVQDFVRLWQPSWAEALVFYHPEYGYYEWCLKHQPIGAFDHQLLAINTFEEAKAQGVSNPWDGDPLLDQPGLSESERAALREQLAQINTNCGREDVRLIQMVHLTVACNNPNLSEEEAEQCARTRVRQANASGFPGYGDDPTMDDDEWRILRDLYRSRRNVLIEEQRQRFINETPFYFTNACIGSDEARTCSRPMDHEAYREKTKRFTTYQDALASLPGDGCSPTPEVVDREIYRHCGKCPQQHDLEVFLSGVAQAKKFDQNFDFPVYPVIPTKEFLEVAFPNPLARQYRWEAEDRGQRLTIRIRQGTAEQCVINLHKLDSDVEWDDMEWIGWLSPITRPTALPRIGGRNFKAKGVLANRETMPLEGSVSCLHLASCDLPRLCEVSEEISDEMLLLSRFLLEERRFTTNSLVLHDARRPLPTFLGENLRRFGGGPKWFWRFLRWGIEGGLPSERRAFVGQLISGHFPTDEFHENQFCKLTFRVLTPGHSFVDSEFSITGIREIYKDDVDSTACASKEVHLDAFAHSGNENEGEPVVIAVTSECHQFGECCVTPAACPAESQLVETHLRPEVDQPFTPFTPAEEERIRPPPTLTNLPACDTCCFTPLPGVPYTNPCTEQLQERFELELERAYEASLDDLRRKIKQKYLSKCLEAIEKFEASFDEQLYHFTLFYYDQAGNLARTVPPKGVDLLDQEAIRRVKAYRDYRGDGERPRPKYPSHIMSTIYRHNSFNEVIATTTPDADKVRVLYDRLGRPVISQDGRQRAAGDLYGYMVYDKFGRVVEAGEIRAGPVRRYETISDHFIEEWRNGKPRTEYTVTHYDTFLNDTVNSYFEGGQQYLRKRVASMVRYRAAPDGGRYRHATHFSYDVHGNVKTLVQENPQMPEEHQIKTITYEYDLISGNLNTRIYQPGKEDQFIHRYAYDADNRMVSVETSRGGIVWDRDAKYSYYDHGPLARVELGEEQVQGLDFAYTIQGQLKGVNSDTLDPARDIGGDGDREGHTIHRAVAADAIGFSLGYYEADYRAITDLSEEANFVAQADRTEFGAQSLFDGSIARLVTANSAFADTHLVQGTAYRYDQLSRLRGMEVFQDIDATLNTWRGVTAVPDYRTRLTYNPNGNIKTLTRTGAGPDRIDDLQYKYKRRTNWLLQVIDRAGTSGHDLDTQPTNNYAYDASGRLIQDLDADITAIEWTAQDKVKKVTKADNDITFAYDAAGRRIMKRSGNTTLWYVLDATGQIMATYTQQGHKVLWKSSPIYGHTRLGVYYPPTEFESAPPNTVTHYRGDVRYELINHLGSVLALVSDRKVPAPLDAAPEDPIYLADIHQAQDYYPFGMIQPGRQMGSAGYRFGFQCMEQDAEIKGDSNSYTTEFRLYDPRIGRWLSVDPLKAKYPGVSPYVAFVNTPTNSLDPLGLDCTGACARGQTGDFTITNEDNTTQSGISIEGELVFTEGLNIRVPSSMAESAEFAQLMGVLSGGQISEDEQPSGNPYATGLGRCEGSSWCFRENEFTNWLMGGLSIASVVVLPVALETLAAVRSTAALNLGNVADDLVIGGGRGGGQTTFFHGTTQEAAESIARRLEPVSTATRPYPRGSFFTHEASHPEALWAASQWPLVQGKTNSLGVRVVEMTVPNETLAALRAEGLIRTGPATPSPQFPEQTVFLPEALDELSDAATFTIRLGEF